MKSQVGFNDGQFGFPQSPHSTTPSQARFTRSSSTPVSEFDIKLGRANLDELASDIVPDLRFHSTFSDFSDISLSANAHESFSIPRLEKYLKTQVDPDFITTLSSLYLSHTRTLVESLRFMHIKKFLNAIGSFMGSLTAPIQKLLHEEDVAIWVGHADWVMYKEMVQMLSPLGLHEIPLQVISGLRSLSQFLPVHLTNTLNNYDRMLQAKLKPARAFCNLLDRLIRANEAGLNAGKILVDPVETRKMRDDWSRFVDPKTIVMREVPCGSVEAQRILGEEVIQLLEDYINDDNKLSFKTGANGEAAVFSKSETIVFKWAQYLSSLPWRFPNASPRLFLLCMSGLLTAALRDISMNGGEGFGAWWVVRCWVDEWMGWSAEMGGFLAMNVDEEELHATVSTDTGSKKDKVPGTESNSTLSSASGSTTTVTSNFGSEELAFSSTVTKPTIPVSRTVDVSITSSTDANDDGNIETNGNGTIVASNNGSRGNGSAPRLVFLRQTASVKHVPVPPTTTSAYEEGLEGMENLLVDVDDMDKTGLVL